MTSFYVMRMTVFLGILKSERRGRAFTAVLVRRLCDQCLSCAGFQDVCGSDSDGSHVQGWSDVHLSQFSCCVRSIGELSFRQSWRVFPPNCRAFMMRAQDNYTLGRWNTCSPFLIGAVYTFHAVYLNRWDDRSVFPTTQPTPSLHPRPQVQAGGW